MFTVFSEDIRAKIFQSIGFFKFCIVDKKLVTCVRNAKEIWVTDFVLELKRAEKLPDFEKLGLHHALQGFIV